MGLVPSLPIIQNLVVEEDFCGYLGNSTLYSTSCYNLSTDSEIRPFSRSWVKSYDGLPRKKGWADELPLL